MWSEIDVKKGDPRERERWNRGDESYELTI